jgi:exosortase E/protease (VPEID-CTERM system)
MHWLCLLEPCCLLKAAAESNRSQFHLVKGARLLRVSPGCSQPRRALRSFGLSHRIACLVTLFALELLAISTWLDAASLSRSNPVTAFMHLWGAWILRFLVAFAALFATFGYLKAKTALHQIAARPLTVPVSLRFLAVHFGAILLFAVLSVPLFGSASSQGVQGDFLVAGWTLAGIVAIAAAGIGFVPSNLWAEMVAATGKLWIFAVLAGLGTCLLSFAGRSLWQPAAGATFGLVGFMLRPFLSSIVADPRTLTIGTSAFSAHIVPECSGYEGMGLITMFGIGWLWLFRRECRFPQALLLLPAGVILIWLLNAVRIAVLILIGNAGAPAVAAGGFHSQAGWIAFNAVALGFIFAAQRLPWVTTAAKQTGQTENPSAAYLMPFLAILAAGTISRALSSGLEWLYPLRFFAVVSVLWFFRKKYTGLDWRCGWAAGAVGVVVFAGWIALDSFTPVPADNGIASGLSAWPQSARLAWLAIRTLAAVVTVPIAEELAFRGFLLRRMITPDFESAGFRRFSWSALLISSAAFGLMHGNRWFAGTIAGILYALVLRRRGRIGDAVAAHATTNALLAVWVLTRGAWHLW